MIAKKRKPIRHTLGDKVFLTLDWIVLVFIFLVIAYPLLYIVSASFSAGVSVMGLSLIPQKVSLIGYQTVFQYQAIWTGYANSLYYTVTGTLCSLALTILCAFPLSQPNFKASGIMTVLCMITMYFSGGLIPTYLTVRSLGILDSVWSVILPGSLSIYNMLVMRTYFKTQIPGELRESAQLDGCNNLRFLTGIVLPLSGPILAVIALFYAVGYWNSYFGPMIYLSTNSKYPLSMVLREILVINTSNIDRMMDVDEMTSLETRKNVMKYAVIVVGSLPVMILYPFVQKHFVRGIMIGAVKG